jgi:uncharacterized membrane protein
MEDKSQGRFAGISLIAAFALPIAVFAGVAIASKWLLAKYIENQDLRTVISFLLAAVVTLAILYAVKMASRHQMKDK